MAKRAPKFKPLAIGDVRDRVVGLRRIEAGSLRHHPRNWRTHPHAQRGTLRDLLVEVGYIKPVDVYTARAGDRYVLDGSLNEGDIVCLDGHLRLETLPQDFLVPCNVTDLTEEEAIKFLVTADPLSALAGQDNEKLTELLSLTSSASENVAKMLGDLIDLGGVEELDDGEAHDFQIMIECKDEGEQRELLEELMKRGIKVRSLIA